MYWIKFAIMLVQLAPQILALIKEIEISFPGASQGPLKRELVIGSVVAAVAADPEAVVVAAGRDLAGAVSSLVATQVGVLNSAGVFPTSGPILNPILRVQAQNRA